MGVRLDSAAISFGGFHCSLQRFLKGVLADCAGSHVFPHLPLPYFDAVTENLQGKLDHSWALFIAHVSLHDRNAPSSRHPSIDAMEELVDDIFVTWVAQQKAADV